MGRLRSIAARLPAAARPARPGGASVGGGVRIVYAPDRDGDPDPGEVVWAWVPYEDDPTQGKDRPVLVIGYDGRRRSAAGGPAGSRDPAHKRDADEWVEVGAGGWDREQRESFANADVCCATPPGDVRREGRRCPATGSTRWWQGPGARAAAPAGAERRPPRRGSRGPGG